MGYFPELNKQDGRQLIPICGRGLFVTDSSTAEFVGANQREAFPLLPYAGSAAVLSAGHVFVFPIEASGFIAILPGAKYAYHEASAYVRFEFNPTAVVQTQLFVFSPQPVAPPQPPMPQPPMPPGPPLNPPVPPVEPSPSSTDLIDYFDTQGGVVQDSSDTAIVPPQPDGSFRVLIHFQSGVSGLFFASAHLPHTALQANDSYPTIIEKGWILIH